MDDSLNTDDRLNAENLCAVILLNGIKVVRYLVWHEKVVSFQGVDAR